MIKSDDANVLAIQTHSKVMLDRLGLKLDYEEDPALRLMRWSIDTGQTGLLWGISWADQMLERLELFDQDAAPVFLGWEGPEVNVNARWLKEVDEPLQVAQILMQSLHLALTEHVDEYEP